MIPYLKTIALGAVLTAPLAQAEPIRVTDDRQITTELVTTPQRVAAISIFAADLMVKLKQPLVALSTRNNRFPEYLAPQLKSPIDLGAAHETNLERLTKAQPDLTVGIKTYTLPVAKKIEEISPFLAFDFNNWADSDRAIYLTSSALNLGKQGQLLNQGFRDLTATFAKRLSKESKQTALLLWVWSDTPVGFYADTHMSTQLMSALNVDNVLGSEDGKLSDVVSMEKILQLDPDSILVFQGDKADLPYHPVWQQLTAYKNGRIYRVSDQYVESHGPIAREYVLREMAHLFYPSVFAVPENIPVAARATPARWTSAN